MAEPRSLDWFGQEVDRDTAARHAQLYDLSVAETADVDFFRQLARSAGGPVLELGCGTGRVAIPLAKDGHRVHGLDASRAMLDRARTKAQAAGVELTLHLGDMRDFALPEPFGLILVPANTFLILEAEDRPACLARIREHLDRDGRFVLDVFQPDPEKIAGLQGTLVHEWTRPDPETGKAVVAYSASHADVDGVQFSFIYEEVDERATGRRYVGAARLHYLYRRELELLLPACGFTLEAMYGSYELDPVTPRSPKLLTVARRRERGEGRDRRAR